MKEKYQAMLVSAAWGFAIWVVISIASGKDEAWDSPIYAMAGLPMLAIGSAILGWIYSTVLGWRCGAFVMAGHALAMLMTGWNSGMGFSLFPMIGILMAIMSLPLLLASAIGAFLKRKKVQDAGKP